VSELVSPFASAAALVRWLKANHAKTSGLWIKFAKKDSGIASVTYPEALEVALCFGWIDGQRKPFDGDWFLQRFTPRGRRSIWSTINRGKALALIEAGRMQPAGLAEIERAKADGRWEAAYEGMKAAVVPPDFAKALKARKLTKAFAAQSSGNRYAMLWRLHQAKKPETRARRLEQFVEMLAKGETIHPARKKP
jgi:uncharacterized protein YdeI (YjbR/CyaY-like superfamily)